MATIGSRLHDADAAIAGASWFAAVGEPLSGAERTEAESYARALRLGALHIASARDWRGAAAIIQDVRWSRAWWNTEEWQRQELTRAAAATFGRHTVMTALSDLASRVGDLVHGQAALAAARAGIADPALTHAAAGAAAMACHQLALAELVDAADDHAFRLRFYLFAGGRWPLCVIEQILYVF